MFLRKLLQILLNYFPLPQNKHLDCFYLDHTAEGCQHELSFLPQACISQGGNLTLPNKPSVSGHLNKATFLNDISLQPTYNHQQNARVSVSDIPMLSAATASRGEEEGLHKALQHSHAGGSTARKALVDTNPITGFFGSLH